MPYELSSTISDFLNDPVLLSEDKLKEIEKLLESADPQLLLNPTQTELPEWREPEIEAGVAVINVTGPLTTKPSLFSYLFGGSTYEGLLRQMNFLAEKDDVKTILLNVDGPGGQAYRMIETGKQMRAIADRSGKKIIAYVDGDAASATAGITVAAHEIVMNPESEFGSIGVVVRLTSSAKAYKKEGYETTYITAGKSKVPVNADGEFKADYLKDIQEKVDTLYEAFTSYVAESRNISQEVVKNTEAKMLTAEKAQSLGLVDKIMEVEQFYNYLADQTDVSDTGASSTTPVVTPLAAQSGESNPQMSGETMTTETSTVDFSAQLAEMKETLDKQNAQLAAYEAKEKTQKHKDLSDSITASFLADSKDAIATYLLSDASDSDKALLNSVISKAEAAHTAIVETSAQNVADAKAEAEAAKAEAESAKEEFAITQTSEEGEHEDERSPQAIIDANVAKLKANQNK